MFRGTYASSWLLAPLSFPVPYWFLQTSFRLIRWVYYWMNNVAICGIDSLDWVTNNLKLLYMWELDSVPVSTIWHGTHAFGSFKRPARRSIPQAGFQYLGTHVVWRIVYHHKTQLWLLRWMTPNLLADYIFFLSFSLA